MWIRNAAGIAASAVAARLVHASVTHPTDGVHASAATAGATCADHVPSSELDLLSYNELFRGQLAPPQPARGAVSTACGPVIYQGGVRWQRGAYGSLWLRIGLDDVPVPSATLSAALNEAHDRTKDVKPNGAAVYVGIQELSLEPILSRLLRAHGFKYHHFRQAPPDGKSFGVGDGGRTGEHVYYKWHGNPNHDMVPAYSSSIEGVGGLLLSPDETRVLLIWEYGNWKPLTGAVDEGESKLTAVEREMREEANITIDKSFEPQYVGGWHMARARDDRVNDNFDAFVLRAASEQFQVDETEISEARWFECSALLKLYQANGNPCPLEVRSLEEGSLPKGRRKVGTTALAWLKTYVDGKALPTASTIRPGGAEWLYFGHGGARLGAADGNR